ncbi:glycerophosphodiester phosphodiesterase [Dongia sp.]|uniref:glycerophosphodiester phosphodiesterase n=1 Tax=Dongia sp. TaxID=1977262 RepID=UPI0035AF056C
MPKRTLSLPRVIGHRGAAEAAPENTLASFREAKRQGAAWVEFDAKLSADNRAFLLHDDNIDRTSNAAGAARALTYDELRVLDAGSWRGPQFAGEKMPLLAEALALFAQEDLQFNLELKPCPGRARDTAKIVLDELAHLWPAAKPKPLISSFVLECLEIARDQAPELPRGLLLEDHPVNWLDLAQNLKADTVNIWDQAATPEWVAEIKAEGYGLLVYTVNDAARARQLIDWGVDGIFTDAPARILAAVGQ